MSYIGVKTLTLGGMPNLWLSRPRGLTAVCNPICYHIRFPGKLSCYVVKSTWLSWVFWKGVFVVAKHVDAGSRCLVAHMKIEGDRRILLPACIKCEKCLKWIRPEDMDKECSGIPFDGKPFVFTQGEN